MDDLVTYEHLVAHAAKYEAEVARTIGPPTLSRAARIFLGALEHRLNGHPWLVRLPATPAPSSDPVLRLAGWLDDGAPGLGCAASECSGDAGWIQADELDPEDRAYVTYLPGAPPIAAACSLADLSRRWIWLLTRGPSPYNRVIAESERVRDRRQLAGSAHDLLPRSRR